MIGSQAQDCLSSCDASSEEAVLEAYDVLVLVYAYFGSKMPAHSKFRVSCQRELQKKHCFFHALV